MSWKDRGKIQQIANRAGKTPRQIVDEAVTEYGSEFRAAIALGVYPNTIRYHLGLVPAKVQR